MKLRTHEKLVFAVSQIYCEKTKSKRYGITDYYEKNRTRDIVIVRQIVMCLLKFDYPKKLTNRKNASYFKQNHACVNHAVKTVSNLCDTEPLMKHIYNECRICFKSEILPIAGFAKFGDKMQINELDR